MCLIIYEFSPHPHSGFDAASCLVLQGGAVWLMEDGAAGRCQTCLFDRNSASVAGGALALGMHDSSRLSSASFWCDKCDFTGSTAVRRPKPPATRAQWRQK